MRRITPDSTSAICCQTSTIWNSYSEITDDNLSYPFSAIAGAVIDRDNTPTPLVAHTITSRPDLGPFLTAYDPLARTYRGCGLADSKSVDRTMAGVAVSREDGEEYPFWHGEAIADLYIDIDDGALAYSAYCDPAC